MVSMGITAVIITVLVTITGVATDTWTRSRSQLRASRQAKVLIDTMAKDFESLVSRRGDTMEWLYVAMDPAADLPAVSKSGGSSSDVAAFTFFTAATDRYDGQIGQSADAGGDVSCVSYRMRFQDPIKGGAGDKDTATFIVYRKLINPNVAFNELLGGDYPKGEVKNLGSEFEDALSGEEVTDQENFICENVHQITATFLVEVMKSGAVETARVVLDSASPSGAFRLKGSGMELESITVDGFALEEIAGGRLTGVELSVSVLSGPAVARVSNGVWDRMKEEDQRKDYSRQSYHYSRVIDVPGG